MLPYDIATSARVDPAVSMPDFSNAILGTESAGIAVQSARYSVVEAAFLNRKSLNSMSTTVMVTTAVVLPPEFVAVTVKASELTTSVARPTMAPVTASNARPFGSTGDTE